ncbi:MAG: glycine cleavage system protein GcvH [Janthinobacterium lividum]
MPEPSDLKYAKTHEWARIEGNIATIGISQHAQEELGDVALVLLPEVGRMVQRGEKFGEIESIKAVSDLYTPVSGEVIEVNEALPDAPESVNDAPYGAGWMLKIQITQPADADLLLSSTEYDELV